MGHYTQYFDNDVCELYKKKQTLINEAEREYEDKNIETFFNITSSLMKGNAYTCLITIGLLNEFVDHCFGEARFYCIDIYFYGHKLKYEDLGTCYSNTIFKATFLPACKICETPSILLEGNYDCGIRLKKRLEYMLDDETGEFDLGRKGYGLDKDNHEDERQKIKRY